MHAGFTFDDAAGITRYLAELGVSHLYLSPVLQAAARSTHGYDVVDPTRVNRELGGEAGHHRLQVALAGAGLGQLLDIVPNHMAITGRDNVWWWDVLENGPSSVYASYFDVDWDPPEAKLRNTVLLPILGDHYGRELEAGRLVVQREDGGFVLRYFDHAAPLTPRSVDDILVPAAVRLDDGAVRGELESLGSAFAKLPLATLTDAESVRERHRDKEILRNRLATLVVERPAAAQAIAAELDALNGDLDRLDSLLDRQNFRLAWWRTAGEELDYRRFFDINDLAGIRVEDPAVFADSHQLILAWLRDGVVDGLRIDHVDGLRDPATYLDRLHSAAPTAWVVVEKILEGNESLPAAWQAAGTTGYDWLNVVAGVLEDGAGDLEVQAAYAVFSGINDRFEEIVHTAKVEVLDGPLASDLNRLAARLTRICDHHRRYRDYTRRDLRDALAAVLVAFPVYRTYVRAARPAGETDIAVVESAVMSAAVRHPDIDDELLGFIRDLLLLRVPGEDERELALRFQQTSGPVMAKALEDTAFYRWVPTSWRNEVGAEPGRLPAGLDSFHEHNALIQANYPQTLLATSTHDTKRSEDVRARLSVLAEQPAMWASVVERWCKANAERDAPPPDRSTEWLLYQTLVGAWPIGAPRLREYMGKATREAKMHTSWTDPDEFYDAALGSFIDEMLGDEAFVADIEAVVEGIRRPGWSVALSQKLLTLTAPGVPDLYQGSETWDFALVDPDNRRAVDYALRRRLLDQVRAVLAAAAQVVAEPPAAERPGARAGAAALWATERGDGATKLAVVHAALSVRAAHPEAFGAGDAGRYVPLLGSGPAAAHLVGFCRGERVVTLATRLPATLERGGGWRGTTVALPPGRWSDRLTGSTWEGRPDLTAVLAGLPVALLVAADGDHTGPTGQEDG